MDSYNTKLQKIKEKGSIDFIKFNYNDENIILKLVDESDETISLLTQWRMKYRDMFATDFTINEEKTKKWIKNDILGNSDKILFLIYVNKKKIGIISHSNYNEENNSCIMDTMMKDPNFHLPGLMTTIEKIYLKWVFDEFDLSKITGFLFSDNENMMNIHTKCGWVITDVVPIEKIRLNENSESIWRTMDSDLENIKPSRYFNLIELNRKNLMKNFKDIEYEVVGN